MSEREFSPEEEEIARQLAEELKRLRVEDLLIQTLINISTIGYRTLGLTEETRGDRDLEQTRLAIETMRAVTPVLEHVVPDQLISDFNASVANLQLAYVKAAGEEGAGSADDRQDEAEEPSGDQPDSASDETDESKEDESA